MSGVEREREREMKWLCVLCVVSVVGCGVGDVKVDVNLDVNLFGEVWFWRLCLNRVNISKY